MFQERRCHLHWQQLDGNGSNDARFENRGDHTRQEHHLAVVTRHEFDVKIFPYSSSIWSPTDGAS